MNKDSMLVKQPNATAELPPTPGTRLIDDSQRMAMQVELYPAEAVSSSALFACSLQYKSGLYVNNQRRPAELHVTMHRKGCNDSGNSWYEFRFKLGVGDISR
jgi:hypothetical protein